MSGKSGMFTSTFIKELNDITHKNISELNTIVQRMGMDNKTQVEWANEIREQLTDLYSSINTEAVDMENKLMKKIEALLKKSEKLCKLLQIDMPQYGSQNLSFYDEHNLLKKSVEEFEAAVTARQNQIDILKSRQLKLCKNLGREPKILPENPLPSAKELDDFNEHIKALELEVFKREEDYLNIKCQLIDLANELEIKPSLDIEKLVLTPDDTTFKVTDDNMKWVNDYFVMLQQQQKEMKEEIENLREKVGSLWEMLSEDIKMCNEFIQKHTGSSVNTFKAWKKEFKRCDELKKANIQKFVQALRNELCDLWEKCHFTNCEREEFPYYRCMTYTEDLLTFHDIEIKKLQKYHGENREIFDLLEKWQKSWNKYVQLEDKAQAPNRFKNRGGTLLQEEKERNLLQKRIPKYEERLIELANNYQERTGKPFLSWGETIPDLISKAHENYKVEKENKLSARKQQRAVTPGQSTMGLSTAMAGSRLRLDTICTPKPGSAMKRVPLSPLFSSKKKSKVTPSRLVIPTLKLNDQVIKRRSRSSMERSKRLRKIRNIGRHVAHGNALNSSIVDYDKFTGALKDDHRSTIFEITPTQQTGRTELKAPRTVH